MEWRHKNLITLEGWTREELGFFLDQTEYMEELLNRSIKKVPALRGKIVMNCFFENSTRTRASFEIAGKVLSADVINCSSSGSRCRFSRASIRHATSCSRAIKASRTPDTSRNCWT